MELFPAPDTAEKLSKDIVGALMVYCIGFLGEGRHGYWVGKELVAVFVDLRGHLFAQ